MKNIFDIKIFEKKVLSKINRGYGYKYYPKKFQFKFLIKKKIFSNKKYNFKKSYNFNIHLASKQTKVNSINIWNFKNFKDREDYSAIHRWTWAIKILSENKKIDKNKIAFIENSIINWCLINSKKKIDKKNIIFEPYNISERVSNYLILIKTGIIKPNIFVLDNLENQFIYLLKNIEYYKYKLSNHALNNLRAIYLFSNFTKNTIIENYSINFIGYLLKKFMDKNGFFRFGSSNYQFIYTRWISDIYLFSKNLNKAKKKILKKNVDNSINCLSFFIEKYRDKLSIPFFGNISPDVQNDWILRFFFKKNENLFFKKYWKLFKAFKDKQKIFSKEWIKIKNNKFSVYSRNPKLIGFDFNHSHNDFFNFVIFVKGKPLVLDLGRENYSRESLKIDLLSKNHNSIIINNKGIYDDYLFFKLKSKLGIKNEENCNYQIKTNYKNYIKLTAKTKLFKIYRIIQILKNKIYLKDIIKLNKYSNIKKRFNLNSTKIKKISNNEFFDYENKINILFNSDKNSFNYLKIIKSYNDYNKSNKSKSLFVEFKNQKNITTTTTFKV